MAKITAQVAHECEQDAAQSEHELDEILSNLEPGVLADLQTVLIELTDTENADAMRSMADNVLILIGDLAVDRINAYMVRKILEAHSDGR